MRDLKELEDKSIFILREAKKQFKNPALLWSIGKDSSTLVYLCKKAFFGKVPFKVIHIDTGYKFREIYEFRDKMKKEWGLDLIIARNKEADRLKITPDKSKFACCNARKTDALKQCVKDNNIDALIVGIRRDEHGIRDKERYFSPRDKEFKWNLVKEKKDKNTADSANSGDSDFVALQDAEFDGWNIFATDFGEETNHVRIHPLLHWSEQDIWRYVEQEKIPMVTLYFARDGKRYRSIGCECCCKPVDSDSNTVKKIISELKKTSVRERSGRDQDKEDENNMQKLRSLGYM